MAITASDLKFKLSSKTSSAGNADASTIANSLGKYMSTTELSTGSGGLNNLFEDISGADNAASTTFYKCIFLHNDHATLTLQGAKVYLTSAVANGANVTIALDTTAVSPEAQSGTPQALEATSATAPGAGVTGLTYSTADGSANALTIGDIAANSCKAVWVKVAAANSAALNADGVTINIVGDTAA